MAEPKDLPELITKWGAGQTTLKEIKGYSDDELFSVAHVGYFFFMQGKNEEARTIFEGLVAIDPRNDYYYRALGVIFNILGEHERALRQFTYAIRLNPTAPHSYVNRSEVHLAMENYDHAEQDLKEALDRMDYRDQQLSKKAWALLKTVSARK